MNLLKKVIAAMLVLMLACSLTISTVNAEETTEEENKIVLGLDPSTLIENEQDIAELPSVLTYSDPSGAVQMDGSKKGIQGVEWMKSQDPDSLGMKHVLINLCMTPMMYGGDTDYIYKGKTYRFNAAYLRAMQKSISILNANGITTSAVLLVQDDVNLPDWEKLVYAPERGHNFYGINTTTKEAKDTWGAVFSFLSEQFGATDCHIDNWILGNEVNMPADYNWTGTLNPETNAKIYAEAFQILYNELQEQNVAVPDRTPAKAYISLDRSWCSNQNGKGIGAKDFMDRFAVNINRLQQNVDWCIAFHPYAVAMDPTSNKFTQAEKLLWGKNPYTPQDINAKYITAANLNVFTEYVKNTYGPQHRIILSEQGFDAKGGENYQAASLAYTFYAGQFNDMVDGMMFRAWEDNSQEMGLQLGISGRKALNVFKYMDTDIYGGETSQCLKTIGIKSWPELVSGFAMPGMAFQDVAHDSWYVNEVRAVNAAGLMTGMNDTNFGANMNLDRGQFATVLYRMEGSPDSGFEQRFPDVADGWFYSIPVTWASQKGIVMGYENGHYGVSDNITREQLATLLYRHAKSVGADVSGRADLSRYGDVHSVSGFASEAMQWVVNQGIIQGEGSTGLLNPQGKVSRAVSATVIKRYKNL